jgi:oligoendopeptidase F
MLLNYKSILTKNIKTKWDLNNIFNTSKFKKERELTLIKLKKFLNKWKGIDLTNTDNLKKFLIDYEKLIYTYTGIFDNEYLYYFLKRLISKNKRIEKKFEKIVTLRKTFYQEIESLFQPLINLHLSQKIKILNSSKLSSYKNFLEYYLIIKEKEIKINLFTEKENILRKEIDNLLIKNKGELKDEILKKYLKLGEEIVNFKLKNILNESEKLNLKSPLDIVFIKDGIEPEIIQKIKKFLLKNKKSFIKFNQNLNVALQVYNKKISLNETIKFLIETFNKVHPSFGEIILEYFKKGYVDVYPRKNKQITPRYIKGNIFQPNFVLLAFEGKLSNLFHIAHEFGHIINIELTRKNEKPINFIQNNIIKEIIANFFELFALECLKDKFVDFKDFEVLKSYVYFSYLQTIRNIVFEEELIKLFKIKKKISHNEITKIWINSGKKIIGEKLNNSLKYSWLLYVRRGMFYTHIYLTAFWFANIILEKFFSNRRFKKILLNLLKTGKYLTLKDFCSFMKLDVNKISFKL